jgi:hypothetical protein
MTFAAIGLPAILGVRVDAAYIDSDGMPVSQEIARSWSRISEQYLNSGRYLDMAWYRILDEGQYRYLDGREYNLMGGLSYVLRHPAYPKLFERVAGGGIGFESAGNTGFFGFYDGYVIGHRPERSVDALPSTAFPTVFVSFNAGEYIDRRWYVYLDKGQYCYLDQTQYLLLGGLGYLYGRFSTDLLYSESTQKLLAAAGKESGAGQRSKVPEPATIAFLGLGLPFLRAFRRRVRA